MPRYPRLFLPEMPLHIVQRGHDQQPVFVQAEDYKYYLDNLREAKDTLSIQVHGYCLMTNHVHLIVTPQAETENISSLMRTLAARQTRYVNKLESRSGTLWEGRFKSSLIDTTSYLLACCRYVDLNPVRAAIVASPDEYCWSSYRSHVGDSDDQLLDLCSPYRELGNSDAECAQAYRAFVAKGSRKSELATVRTALQRNQPTGSRRFCDEIEQRIGRRISTHGQGRPRFRK
jgi:putative transposase